MTTVSVLQVEIRGRDVNLMPLITALEARLKAADAAGLRTAGVMAGPLAGAMRQTASGALALQQAQARLEAQQGNLVGAANRLRNALAQTTTTTTQTIAARRQLLAVEQQLATGQSGLARAFSEAGSAARSSLTSMIGPAALVTTGLTIATGVVQSFADAFKFKADLDATTASINAQLKGVRDTSVVYAQASEFANRYKLTQQETTQAIAASIGVMRASKASVEDILSVLARLQVLSPEQSLQEAAVAIKALASGDTTSLVTRFEVGRDVAAQMKQEIAGGADAVAVMNKFLIDTGIGMDALTAKTTGAAGALKDVAIAQEELTLAQAQFAQGPGIAILNTQIGVTRGLTRLLSGDFQAMGASIIQATGAGSQFAGTIQSIAGNLTSVSTASTQFTQVAAQVLTTANSYEEYGKKVSFANEQLAQIGAHIGVLTGAQFDYAKALIESGQNATAAAAAAEQLATVINAAAVADTTWGEAHGQLLASMLALASGSEAERLAVESLSAQFNAGSISGDAFRAQIAALAAEHNANAQATALDRIESEHLTAVHVDAAAAARQHTEALNADAAQALLNQVATQELGLREAALAQQSQLTAQALLNSGAAGAATAARLAGSSSLVDQLTAAYFRLAQAQQVAGAGSAVDPSGQQRTNQLEAQANAYKKIRDAQEQQVLSTGTAAQRQATLNAQLERARVTSGQQSVEYIRAQTALKQFQQQQDKPARGGGGGGVKLSDQQKLNNQLLTDQERFGAKSEDLELKHGLKLLSIERDANEKRAAAAKAFQQARADSDASFYRSIGDIQDSGIQQLASAQFEQALAQAEEIGRTKGQDAAKAYLEARREAILQDAKTQEEINKALAEGDGGRAEFLSGIQAKERKANDERLRQIEENGSAIENERARQIADEERSYEESQGRIADQAETSAARRIAANERAGKAIDPERIAVQGLTADYEKLARVGGRSPTAGTTNGAAPTGTTTTASPTEAAPPTDLAALMETWRAIGAEITKAVAATERAVRDGSSQVASAVGGRALV